MSRVNVEMKVNRGTHIQELLARLCLERTSEVWWTGGKAACKNMEKKSRENIGRKLVDGNSIVARCCNKRGPGLE